MIKEISIETTARKETEKSQAQRIQILTLEAKGVRHVPVRATICLEMGQLFFGKYMNSTRLKNIWKMYFLNSKWLKCGVNIFL